MVSLIKEGVIIKKVFPSEMGLGRVFDRSYSSGKTPNMMGKKTSQLKYIKFF